MHSPWNWKKRSFLRTSLIIKTFKHLKSHLFLKGAKDRSLSTRRCLYTRSGRSRHFAIVVFVNEAHEVQQSTGITVLIIYKRSVTSVFLLWVTKAPCCFAHSPYHAIILKTLSFNMTLAAESTIQLCCHPKKSEETSSSSLTQRTLASGPRLLRPVEASRIGRKSSSLEATGLLRRTVRSTMDTLLTGTRTETPTVRDNPLI